MAEYFRDEKKQDVLLFIDNIFRFTQAGSEVSALLGRDVYKRQVVLLAVLLLCIKGYSSAVAVHSPFSAFSRFHQLKMADSLIAVSYTHLFAIPIVAASLATLKDNL